jgi:NADH-quinone oxidoreductase subunit I
MPIAESDIRWVKPPQMNLWDMLYVPAIVQGLQTTVRHMAKTLAGQDVTTRFPEERPKLPAHFRGIHRLNRDEEGRVKCVACYLCATACPAHCIDIVAAPSPWPDREKYPETFVLDELRCIYCGMCEEACPVDAIELTTLFDLTGYSRKEMMFDKEKLLSVFDQTVKDGTDPVRTQRGRLGPASEIEAPLPILGAATDKKGRP